MIAGAYLTVAANNLNELMPTRHAPVGIAEDTEDLCANVQESIEHCETICDRAQQLVDNPVSENTSLISYAAAPRPSQILGPILK